MLAGAGSAKRPGANVLCNIQRGQADINESPVKSLSDRPVERASVIVKFVKGRAKMKLGKKILRDSGLPIVSAENLADAAEKVVKAVREAA